MYREATGQIESFDLRRPFPESIDLTNQDDFRLLIQPSQTRYIYIYLVDSNDNYQSLHPETGFNPLHPAVTTLLPGQPNGFYFSAESGVYHLLLISELQAIPELEELRQQHAENNFEAIQNTQKEYLEVWDLTLNLRDE